MEIEINFFTVIQPVSMFVLGFIIGQNWKKIQRWAQDRLDDGELYYRK